MIALHCFSKISLTFFRETCRVRIAHDGSCSECVFNRKYRCHIAVFSIGSASWTDTKLPAGEFFTCW